jgi:membrane protein implicated in regulation of membrane protease activity
MKRLMTPRQYLIVLHDVLATAAATIAASVGLIASAKPSEQLISLIPLAVAALLYFWLRRR